MKKNDGFQIIAFVCHIVFAIVLFFSLLFRVNFQVANAQTPLPSPQAKEVVVTAKVPDHIPPSMPILISPENGAILSDNQTPLVWQLSTDLQTLTPVTYQLWFDGVLFAENITGSSQTATYTTTTDGITITLVFTTPIPDGLHTWKIVAVDGAGNMADSATWQFTIDTVSPFITVTQIETYGTSITSQDVSSVPTEPFVLTHQLGQLQGFTEPYSNVQVTFFFSYDEITRYSVADSNGMYTVEIPVLPYDEVVEVQVLSADPAGNVGVLDGILLVYRPARIVLPPPFGTYIPPIVQPTLEEYVATTTQTAEQIITHTLEKALPYKQAQSIAQTLVRNILPSIGIVLLTLDALSRFLFALASVGVPVSALSFHVLRLVAHSLWFTPLRGILFFLPFLSRKKRLGYVHDDVSHAGIPFAMISAVSVEDVKQTAVPQQVADREGYYDELVLDDKKTYKLEVQHKYYRALVKTLSEENEKQPPWYVGQILRSELCKLPLDVSLSDDFDSGSGSDTAYGVICKDQKMYAAYLIPTAYTDETKQNQQKETDLRTVYRKKMRTRMSSPLGFFFLSGFFTVLFPHVFNICVTAFYMVIISRNLLVNKR
jgi:hypothetical protein